MWRGPGVLRAQELLSAKRESEDKKRHKTSFCFGGAKTDRTPSQEMRDPQGTTKGERVIGAKEYAKSRFFLYGERSPRGTIIFDTKCETEKNNFFLFGHKGKKRPGKGINIGPELCPREGYHISGNNNLTKERE